jgi:anti-anti-sigma factor
VITVTPISETLDELSSARLRVAMQEHVKQGRLKHIFDLRDLRLLETGTLSGLIRSLRTLREAGGSATLVADQPRIRTILHATGLDRVFGVYDDVSDAIGSLQRKHLVPIGGGADIA